eukprot:Skav200081  [mRNA]  locus=scaffold4413:118925:128308:- [translate_table: standard]
MLQQRPYLKEGRLMPRRPAPSEALSLLPGQESVFMSWDRHELWVYACGVDPTRGAGQAARPATGAKLGEAPHALDQDALIVASARGSWGEALGAAAEADEPPEQNFVRKHAMEQAPATPWSGAIGAQELNISLRQAAVLLQQGLMQHCQAATRVFSNAAGSYSANVGIAIENGANVDEDQLQEQFVTRKGFALSSDAPGELQEASGLFKSALSKAPTWCPHYRSSGDEGAVDVTFQNLDSSEISLTDVSHYFDNDPTKVVGNLRKDGVTNQLDDGKKPASLIADTTTANAQANLNGGYEGVREISKRMRFTFGWSTTADAVPWICSFGL